MDNNDPTPEDWDPAVVDIRDPFQLRRWCQHLVCTEAMLRDAVATAGRNPAAVRAHLAAVDRGVPGRRRTS